MTVKTATAYIDEAGFKGYSRNLETDVDDNIGLVCAVVFPSEKLSEFRNAYRDGYDRFCKAAPSGAKLHFTDAFKPGNEAWAAVARPVRDEFIGLLQEQDAKIVYDARRMRLQREGHERLEGIKKADRDARRSPISVPDRPDKSKVETQLIQGLALKLDALMEDFERDRVDLYFDTIDKELAKHYEREIEWLSHKGPRIYLKKGWNRETKKKVEGKIKFEVHGFVREISRLGTLVVVGKGDPLVLAVDGVANSLLHHLDSLPNDAKLNAQMSIVNWALETQVYGVRNDALEDLI